MEWHIEVVIFVRKSHPHNENIAAVLGLTTELIVHSKYIYSGINSILKSALKFLLQPCIDIFSIQLFKP